MPPPRRTIGSRRKRKRGGVWWTDHAIRRARERFGSVRNVETPFGRIMRAAECLRERGIEFRVTTKAATFVCVVGRNSKAIIKTVW